LLRSYGDVVSGASLQLSDEAARRQPDNFWVTRAVGEHMLLYGRYTEAAGYFRAALGSRPEVAELHEDLGRALINDGRIDEALAEFRHAVKLSPASRSTRPNLVKALAEAGRWMEARAEYRTALDADPSSIMPVCSCLHLLHRDEEVVVLCRKAIEINPNDATAHAILGASLARTGQHEKAVTAYRKATELDPSYFYSHQLFARELTIVGHPAEAIAQLETAIALLPALDRDWHGRTPTKGDPGYFSIDMRCQVWIELGQILRAQSRPQEAVTAFRKAAEFNPKSTQAWDSLASALLDQGRFAEARAATQRVLDLPATEPERRAERRLFNLCDTLVPVTDRLPAILAGKERPAGIATQRALAEWCLKYRGLPATALGFYQSALRAEPSLADDLEASNRFHAACAAAQVSCGVAKDASPLDDQQRLVLRKQTLEWLTAEYDAWAERHRRGKRGDRTPAATAVRSWQQNEALAGIRDEQALARLPVEERRAWQALWSKVTSLAARDPYALFARARDHIARREWKDVTECYREGLELEEPLDGGEAWFDYAAAQLLSGDRPGYHRTCALMLERGEKTPRLRPYLVARAGTLAPDPSDDLERLHELSRPDLLKAETSFWSLTEQGAMAIRMGQFQLAVRPLELSLRADGRPGRAVLNWLWLALAYQKLGKDEEARRWLDMATGWLDQQEGRMPEDTSYSNLGLHRHNWIEAHVLRHEAEALLR
jgi:Flp pilus assembly protein TadD